MAKDTLAVKTQVFQAALLTVVNGAFNTNLSALPKAEYDSMAQALLELGRVYARLTPTKDPADAATSTNWLNTLWQAAQTGSVAELDRVQTLLSSQFGQLANPTQGLLFVARLVTAAGNIVETRTDMKSAAFIAKLIKFGVEIARVNPTVTAGANDDSDWIENLIEGASAAKVQAGLSEFFNGLNSSLTRLQALEFSSRLIATAQQFQDSNLQTDKKEAGFLNQLIDLGSAYTEVAANPSFLPVGTPDFYLNTLWQSSDLAQNANLLESYLLQIIAGDETSAAIQSTRQFLYALEFSQEDISDTNKGQAQARLAFNVRKTFRNQGKYQTPARGGGDDPALIPEHLGPGIRLQYVNHRGELFVKGSGDGRDIWFNDARQGALGDCYLIAAMAAAAITRPDQIRSLFKNNGDGTYNITFRYPNRHRSTSRTIRVDQDLPVTDPRIPGSGLFYARSTDEASTGQELWSALLEKAYVRRNGNSYAGIEWGDPKEALSAFTGQTVSRDNMNGGAFGIGKWSEDDLLKTIKNAIANKQAVLVSTKNAGMLGGLTDSHVYVPLGVDSKNRLVTL